MQTKKWLFQQAIVKLGKVPPDRTPTGDFKQSSLVFKEDIDYSEVNINNLICPPLEVIPAEFQADNKQKSQNIVESTHHMSNFSNHYNSSTIDQFHSINTMKFSKPIIDAPNNFESETTPNIMSDLKHICAIADGHQSSHSDHNKFMDTAFTEVVKRKKSKINAKNKASKKRQIIQTKTLDNVGCEMKLEYSNINATNFSNGTLRIVKIKIKDYVIEALLDTGSTASIINAEVAKLLKLHIEPCKVRITTSNGSSDDNCIGSTQIKYSIRDTKACFHKLKSRLLVCKQSNNFSAIIGTDIIYESLQSTITSSTWTFKAHNSELSIPLYTMDGNYERDITLWSQDKIVANPHEELLLNLHIKPTEKVQTGDTIRSFSSGKLNKNLTVIDSIDKVKLDGNKYVAQVLLHNKTSSPITIHANRAIADAQVIPVGKSENINNHKFLQMISSQSFVENTPLENSNQEAEKEFDNYISNPTKIERNHAIVNQSSDQSVKEPQRLQDNYAFTENRDFKTTVCSSDKSYLTEQLSTNDISLLHMSKEQKDIIQSSIKKYEEVFSKHNYDIGKTNLVTHDIQLTSIPKSQPKRFLPPQKLEFCKVAISKLAKADIVRVCEHPLHLSNLVLVPKTIKRDNSKAAALSKNDENIRGWRVCQDLTTLNKNCSNVQRVPSINIDEFIAKLGNKYVSCFDITQCYYHIPLSARSQRLTAFYVGENVYAWNRLTMGQISAASTLKKLFQLCFHDSVLKEFKQHRLHPSKHHLVGDSYENFLQSYFDDSYLYSDTFEQHIPRLEAVLFAFQKAGLKLNPAKSQFFTTKFNILGYEMDTFNQSIFMDKCKISTIQGWRRPGSLYELQSRIAVLGYFARFLPNFKTIIYPLIHMLRQRKFIWSEVEERSWRAIKLMVALEIKCTIPQPNQRLYMFVDASSVGCSQHLFILVNDQLKMVATNSKLFGAMDCGKSAYFKELLSLIVGIKHFEPLLAASHVPPTILTDAKSLLSQAQKQNSSLAAASLLNQLAHYSQIYDFNLVHVAGKYNVIADVFSREFENSTTIQEKKVISEEYCNLPDEFLIKSEELYNYLTMGLPAPQSNKAKKPKPLSNLKDIYAGAIPEKRYIDLLTSLQESDPSQLAKVSIKNRANNTRKVTLQSVGHKCQSNRLTTPYIITDGPIFWSDNTELCANLNNTVSTLSQQLLQFNSETILHGKVERNTFSNLQKEDNFLSKCFQDTKNNPKSPFLVIDGILYKKGKCTSRLCIPSAILFELFRDIHSKLAHLSKYKMVQVFNMHYFAKDAEKAAQKVKTSCFQCTLLASPDKKKFQAGSLRSFRPDRPREGWSLDLIVSLPKSNEGFTTMLLATCLFSKFTTTYFLTSKSNAEITKALLTHFSVFGMPKHIICDNDTGIKSALLPLAQQFQFTAQILPTNAQHQNLVERNYKELKKLITNVIYDPKNDLKSRNKWPQAVVIALQALNATPIENIHYSREQIMFRFENFIQLCKWSTPNLSNLDSDIENTMKNYFKNINHFRPNNHAHSKYKVNEIIYIRDAKVYPAGFNRKFLPKHRGPLIITKIDNDRLTGLAKELNTSKEHNFHFKDVILLENPNEVLAILSKDWNDQLTK